MSMTHEDNELMCRVENGAPMGRFLRENFWFPAILSQKLIADGAPEPVRLLGENFVAFRATDGRVALFPEHCPHRRASLLLARNEDNALRCIFHGWKFGVDGQVKECPTQAEHHDAFCKKVPLKHFPTHETAGIVWVWLGAAPPVPFPDFEFTRFSGKHSYATFQTLRFNWIQSLEGLVDSAHVPILHKDWLGAAAGANTGSDLSAVSKDLAPTFEFEDTPGGFRYAAVRKAGEGRRYIRLTEYVAPWYTFIPFDQGHVLLSVPIDDTTTALWVIEYNAKTAVTPSWFSPAEDPGNWPPYLKHGREQRWGQDRAEMKRGSFSGFREHFIHEDFAVAESQGVIADRSQEFLASSDRAVVRLRRLLVDSAKDHRDGKLPQVAKHSEIPFSKIRAAGKVVGPEVHWRDVVLSVEWGA